MKTRKIIMAALFAALVCVATMVIKVPSPKGYVNLGDSVVLLSGWMMSPLYGFFAAAIGSALADLLLAFGIYAPATFVIKGSMALLVSFCAKALNKKTGKLASRIIGAVLAEILMIAGYFVFEAFIYESFWTAAMSILFNAVQGLFGLVAGLVLVKVFEKSGIMK